MSCEHVCVCVSMYIQQPFTILFNMYLNLETRLSVTLLKKLDGSVRAPVNRFTRNSFQSLYLSSIAAMSVLHGYFTLRFT